MSFVDGGDLASIAAIAVSTLENNDKDETETPEEQALQKEAEASLEPEDDTHVSMALHMPDTDIQTQKLPEELPPTSELHEAQAADQAEQVPIEEHEEAKPVDEATEEVTDQIADTIPTSEVSHEVTTSDGQFQSDEQQSTYANLQPIFLAMEMGQDAIHTSQSDGQHQEETTTSTVMSQQPHVVQVTQASTDNQNMTSQFVFSQQVQGASMLLNNLVSTTADGTPTSLQSILQDVVSGMQTSSGTVPAAIITDPSSSTGSYLIVNQNGIPIVRPVLVSNMPDSAGGHHELQVLSAGAHGLEEGGAGDGSHETMTVEVGANTDTGSSGAAGMTGVDVEPSMDLGSVSEGISVGVHHHDGSGDEDCHPSRSASSKRKLSDGPRICEECNKAFKYPSDLKKHLQIHTNVKKFKCDHCDRMFRRLHQLNVHARIHTGEKPYVCNRCGIAFRHDSTLTMHIRTRHDHLRPFKCEECGNTFGRLSHLRKHVRKVCGNRRNKDRSIAQCRFCDENFPSKGDLRKHVLSCEKKEEKVKAKEVTLHVCDQCSKDFASPYNLRRHQLTHTDEKPFQCDVCARQFKEKSSLSKHIKRKHTGVDQGSQTDETGETEFNNVDVIAESAAVSGVSMDTEEDLEDEETSTVDASSLLPSDAVHMPNHEVRVQGTQVIQGDIEMTTIELSLPPGTETNEATALQAAVEALVTAANQQDIAVEQESMEVTTEEAGPGKEIFEGGETQGVVTSEVEYPVQESKPEEVVQLPDPGLVAPEDTPAEFVTTTTTSLVTQEQVTTQ